MDSPERLSLVAKSDLPDDGASAEVTRRLRALAASSAIGAATNDRAVLPAHRVVFLPGEALLCFETKSSAAGRIMLHNSAEGKRFVKGFLVAGDAAAEFFGRAIAAARSERGLKRMQLKDRSGLSYPYISEIENGGKYPSQRAIQNLADALDMTPSELLARAEQIESAEAGGGEVSFSMPPDEMGSALEAMPRIRSPRETAGAEEEDLVGHLTDRVMRAIEVPLRELVLREVQMTIREELLRRRDGR